MKISRTTRGYSKNMILKTCTSKIDEMKSYRISWDLEERLAINPQYQNYTAARFNDETFVITLDEFNFLNECFAHELEEYAILNY